MISPTLRTEYEEDRDRRLALDQRVTAILVTHQVPPELLDALRLLSNPTTRAKLNDIIERVNLRQLFDELDAARQESFDAFYAQFPTLCDRCNRADDVAHDTFMHGKFCGICRAEHLVRPSAPASTVLTNALRKSRQAKTPSTLNTVQWQSTVEHFQDRCAYCRGPWNLIEHVTSIAIGGGTTLANCLPSCMRCNGRKGSKTLEALIREHAHDHDRAYHDHLCRALAWLKQCGRSHNP